MYLIAFGLCSCEKDFLKSKQFLHDEVPFPLGLNVSVFGEG